ncbi:MAG: restriction endonuclease subunit S [Clostridia bacterium]|nr:restriction endonuclease subunit S [Clostridia bacterium]
MQDSGIPWIGEIPSSWNTIRAKRIFSLVVDPSDNPRKIALENIESHTGRFIQTSSIFDGQGINVKIGDIVYGKLRPYLCKAWLADFECNAVGDFCVFRCSQDVYAGFIHKLFLSPQFASVVNASTYGAKMPRISPNFVLSLILPVPPLNEQITISKFIDSQCVEIDELIAVEEETITELQAYKQSVIAEAVTKGLNPDAPMKDSGIPWIGQIPEHWTVEKAKHIFNLRMTKGNSKTILLSATQDRGMCPQSMLASVVQVAENTDLQIFKTVHKNDFVISLRSFQGGFEISKYEGVCSPAYQVFYNKANINQDYFRILFKSRNFIDHINSLTEGIREGKNIQYASFSYSYLPVPPLDEQKSIAEFIDRKCSEIDSLIEIKQQKIAELKEYKKSLIYEYVTGKKEVPVEAD